MWPLSRFVGVRFLFSVSLSSGYVVVECSRGNMASFIIIIQRPRVYLRRPWEVEMNCPISIRSMVVDDLEHYLLHTTY